ncbi:MAG: arsinothricin resistance N-acetyltransferase ArsN1 family B [Pseudomonadota bacterium]
MKATIRPARPADSTEIAAIYSHYVLNSHCTFETEVVSADEIQRRIRETLVLPLPWLVSVSSDKIVGYAYASKWKGRCAYQFSVESTIYIDSAHTSKGIGLALYTTLIETIRNLPMHAVIGGIALPNEPSIHLHESLGFKKVGHFEQVGYKQNRWIDVGYWQLML